MARHAVVLWYGAVIELRDPFFCPEDGSPMRLKLGAGYDPFFSCSMYPGCRVTRQAQRDPEGRWVPVLTERDNEEAMVRWLRA